MANKYVADYLGEDAVQANLLAAEAKKSSMKMVQIKADVFRMFLNAAKKHLGDGATEADVKKEARRVFEVWAKEFTSRAYEDVVCAIGDFDVVVDP